MKLFTIGDSISQGFMSLAAARTELSFSTLIARSLGLTPGTDDYPLPFWGAGGFPLNIETLLRKLASRFGSDIKGIFEWPAAIGLVREEFDLIETYYERGPANIALPQAGNRTFYPNVAVRGFTVADAWLIDAKTCIERIALDSRGGGDGMFQLPNCGLERTAHAVLNPSRDPAFGGFSQLGWLKHHVENGGVENLVLWLGSNNALGTIVQMDVASTAEAKGKSPLAMSLDERNRYNLWTPPHFDEEYEELMRRVHKIMSRNKSKARVFVATVPSVTVAPLARGIGEPKPYKDPFGVLPQANYFDSYNYFLFKGKFEGGTRRSLRFADIYRIDETIAAYNVTIAGKVAAYDALAKKEAAPVSYHLVDVSRQLLNLAFKRNDGNPPYKLPNELQAYVERTGRPVNTVYYDVERNGTMVSGGIFSLDGVHPTAIGQGLIAREFLAAMASAGVKIKRDLDWDAIVASDTLYGNPIPIMRELYDNTAIWGIVVDLFRWLNRRGNDLA